MRTIHKALWVLAVAALVLQIYIAVAHPPIIAEYVKAALLGAMLSILLHDLPPVKRGVKLLQEHTPSVILMAALILGATVFYYAFPIYTARVVTYSRIGQFNGGYNATIGALLIEETRNRAGWHTIDTTYLGTITTLRDSDASRLIQAVVTHPYIGEGNIVNLTRGTFYLTAPINFTISGITLTGGTLVGNCTPFIQIPTTYNVTNIVIRDITFNQTSTAISLPSFIPP